MTLNAMAASFKPPTAPSSLSLNKTRRPRRQPRNKEPRTIASNNNSQPTSQHAHPATATPAVDLDLMSNRFALLATNDGEDSYIHSKSQSPKSTSSGLQLHSECASVDSHIHGPESAPQTTPRVATSARIGPSPKMHATSSNWRQRRPDRQAANRRIGLNQARRKLCRNSPFWDIDYDIDTHDREWQKLKDLEAKRKVEAYRKSLQLESVDKFLGLEPPTPPNGSSASSWRRPNLSITIPPPTRSRSPTLQPAFRDAKFTSPLSPVLSLPTLFTPSFRTLCKDFGPDARSQLSPWPEKPEMKYEGDDRIATDRLHARFLPAPRVAGNETVTWQQRAVITQWPLENFLLGRGDPVEVWFRGHWIEELEVSDQEGEGLVGKGLMDELGRLF